MLNSDSLNYILQQANSKELAELSKAVAQLKVPSWHAFIIPIVSLLTGIIGVVGSYIVAMQLFKRNKRLELEKIGISTDTQKQIRKENEQKELIKACGILYGDMVAINYELQISVLTAGKAALEYDFKSALLTIVTTGEKLDKLNADIKKSFENYGKEISDFNGISKNFMSKLNQYIFINKETTVRPYLDELQATGFKPKYTKEFTANLSLEELIQVRRLRDQELEGFVYNDLGELTHKILGCLYHMN